ncbi:MAG: hypothetical protein LIP06_04890, partial [Tannerellaceae bacterium]|nr:hypothetical protein [Tannerellaceae bacterium]
YYWIHRFFLIRKKKKTILKSNPKNYNFMKLNFVFCLFLIAGCLFTSCNKEEVLMDYELTEVEARAPYISPQMQEILAMLDTCTTAIPFEKLVPVADSTLLSINFISNEDMLFPEISTKATESLTATGYTYVSALYSLNKQLLMKHKS